MNNLRALKRSATLATVVAGIVGLSVPAYAEQTLTAPTIAHTASKTSDRKPSIWREFFSALLPAAGTGPQRSRPFHVNGPSMVIPSSCSGSDDSSSSPGSTPLMANKYAMTSA